MTPCSLAGDKKRINIARDGCTEHNVCFIDGVTNITKTKQKFAEYLILFFSLRNDSIQRGMISLKVSEGQKVEIIRVSFQASTQGKVVAIVRASSVKS